MLVVSPTRELAAQIAEEAKQLTAFQQNFTVQVRCPRAYSARILFPPADSEDPARHCSTVDASFLAMSR